MKLLHSAAAAREKLGLAPAPELAAVDEVYPTLVSDYYLNLIDPAAGEADPIYRQCLPAAVELDDADSSFDPLAENRQMPAPRLIHRFTDRVVLLATGRCATRCRFCFRKRTWAKNGEPLADITDAELESAAAYLRKHPEIREVLISGGDPLMLPLARLARIFAVLQAIPSLEVFRLASRLPAVWPQGITPELVELLAPVRGLWFATHFNHPRELTPEAAAALDRLVQAGIPVVNQTVLLAGVNDDPDVLESLCRKLIAVKVKPHYLFHVDPVRGVRHFATGIERGFDMLRHFRPRLSSLAVPTFAIDLPEGGGKIALQPEYRDAAGRFPDLDGSRRISYPEKREP